MRGRVGRLLYVMVGGITIHGLGGFFHSAKKLEYNGVLQRLGASSGVTFPVANINKPYM